MLFPMRAAAERQAQRVAVCHGAMGHGSLLARRLYEALCEPRSILLLERRMRRQRSWI